MDYGTAIMELLKKNPIPEQMAGINIKDENGNCRSTYDILKDLSEKYEQSFEQDGKWKNSKS